MRFSPDDIEWEAFDIFQRLDRVLHLVSSNVRRRVTLTEAAAQARMSITAFSDFFHNTAGVTYKPWHDHVHIVHCAMPLLRTTNRSVEDIAEVAGFGSGTTFRRTFKRHTGKTPSAYRAWSRGRPFPQETLAIALQSTRRSEKLREISKELRDFAEERS